MFSFCFSLVAYYELGYNESDIGPVFNAGGYGTLEELLEVITWAQLGIHNKPVSLLLQATASYYFWEIHDHEQKLMLLSLNFCRWGC